MIFKVPEDYGGSFVLSSIGVILRAGKKICIEGKKILSPDVKMAIKNKILIPFEDEDKKEYTDIYSDKSNELMIINKTDKILSINSIILKPWSCLLVDKKSIDNNSFKSAEEKGYISIISDDDQIEGTYKNKKDINISGLKKEDNKKEVNKNGKDERSVVWDFNKQKIKEAELIDVTSQPRYLEEEDNVSSVKELDSKKTNSKKTNSKKTNSKKTNSKKTNSKKTNSKKTNSKKTNSKKTNSKKTIEAHTIKPVGEKINGNEEAVVELDSRGNPVNKVSDVLIDLIETVEEKGISFVDEEQKMERLKKNNIEDKNKNNG